MGKQSRKIILIGNYGPDKQQSMNRFADMLQNGLRQNGLQTEIWQPVIFFGGLVNNTNTGIGKWLGYIDKWIISQICLFIKSRFSMLKKNNLYFHICDHSNAIYQSVLPANKTSITCHDVLAIRAALGYPDTYCATSKTGIYLQKWILHSLSKVQKIVCVSGFTQRQLLELITPAPNQHIITIYNPLNNVFANVDQNEVNMVLNKYNIPLNIPYLFHVGSALERKNRELLLKIFPDIKRSIQLVFAGQPFNSSMKRLIDELKIESYTYSVVHPSHEELQALYSGAHAFIFPSFSEGFGWPVIEAQACGTPVVASNIAPMPEVGGDGALYASPFDASDFVKQISFLTEETFRQEIINKGYSNLKRFDGTEIMKQYEEFIYLKI